MPYIQIVSEPEPDNQTIGLITPEPTIQAPLPVDPNARAAVSVHCRETVTSNDAVGAWLTLANVIAIGLSFLVVVDGHMIASSPMPLFITGLGLLVGSAALALGGRYAGRASARRHLHANLYRQAEREVSDGEPDPNAIEAARNERSEQGYATTYDWLIATAEALFVSGLVCVVVYLALTRSVH